MILTHIAHHKESEAYMEECTVRVESAGGVTILYLGGSLRRDDTIKITAFVTQELEARRRGLIFDTGKLNHVDSGSLGALIAAERLAAEHHVRLIIWRPTDELKTLIATAKLGSILIIEEGDRKAAIAAATKPADG